jgi:hypothetical protein
MTNFKRVVFVNYFHNGDLHISREFIRKIKNHFPNYTYTYAHDKDPYVMKDLEIDYMKSNKVPMRKDAFGSFVKDNVLYLNTWYGSYGQLFNGSCGIAYDALYGVFNHHLKLNFETELVNIDKDPKNFFPTINYNVYKTDNVDRFFAEQAIKFNKIFVFSNGPCLSGQANNFSMGGMINNFAKKYKTDLFIYTNKDNRIEKLPNVFFSGDIIGHNLNCNLNENSYITSKSDVIVGRSSGVYTFAMTQDNMFNNKKLMVSFSTIGKNDGKYWLAHHMAPKITYNSRVVNYSVNEPGKASNVLESELKCHFK